MDGSEREAAKRKTGDCVMMGQTIVEPLNEGAERKKAESGKSQRRAAARKIGKMIKRCKAETESIKRLDEEQKEFLERLRKKL